MQLTLVTYSGDGTKQLAVMISPTPEEIESVIRKEEDEYQNGNEYKVIRDECGIYRIEQSDGYKNDDYGYVISLVEFLPTKSGIKL